MTRRNPATWRAGCRRGESRWKRRRKRIQASTNKEKQEKKHKENINKQRHKNVNTWKIVFLCWYVLNFCCPFCLLNSMCFIYYGDEQGKASLRSASGAGEQMWRSHTALVDASSSPSPSYIIKAPLSSEGMNEGDEEKEDRLYEVYGDTGALKALNRSAACLNGSEGKVTMGDSRGQKSKGKNIPKKESMGFFVTSHFKKRVVTSL